MRRTAQVIVILLLVPIILSSGNRISSAFAYTTKDVGFVGITWNYDYVWQRDDGPDDILNIVLFEWYNVDITETDETSSDGSSFRSIAIQSAYNPLAPGSENSFAIDVKKASGKFYVYNNNTETYELGCEVKTGEVGTFFDPNLAIITSSMSGNFETRHVGINSSELIFPECEKNDPYGYLSNGLRFLVNSAMPNVNGMTFSQLDKCLSDGSCEHQVLTTTTEIYDKSIRTISTTAAIQLYVGDNINMPPTPENTHILPNSVMWLLMHAPKSK